MFKYYFLSVLHFYSFSVAKLIKQVYGINLFGYIAYQKVYIVLCNLQATMTEKSGEGYHVAAVQNPLSCKCMTVSVNTGGFNPSPLIVFVKHVVARAFHKLLSKYITKEKIVFVVMFAIF
jgi:hypothetical protein